MTEQTPIRRSKRWPMAQTLTVDPDGNDITGNGGPANPFQTIQKAHDYAEENIDLDKEVVVKINAGTYTEDITVTRPKINFIGLSNNVSRATRISGQLTITVSQSVGLYTDNIISFENLILSSSAGSSVVTISGSVPHTTSFKNSQVTSFSANSKCLNVTNNSADGNLIYITDCVFSNRDSSATTIDFSNTSYANISRLQVYNGSGKAMNITTSRAIIENSKFEGYYGATTMISVNSTFGTPSATNVALTLGSSTIINSTTNGNGLELASGVITNVGQAAFSIGTAAGTGFAVKGVAGAVFVNGNNLIVPGTNNKISTAITRTALGTSLTPA